VVNGHKHATHTDSPDGGTGKTCLGAGMHCPSASSCLYFTDVRCGYNWNALEFVRDLYFVTESRIKSIRLPVSELFRLACT